MKTVTINLPGSGKWEELQLAPGATARDVLSQLGLGEDFCLVRWNSVNTFDDRANLYKEVADGDKLQATSVTEVAGNGRR
jgi:hypothetical protein